MVESLVQGVGHSAAEPRAFTEDEINDGKAIDTEDWTAVASKEGDKNNAFGAGFGPENRNQNSHGRSDFDLQVTPDDGTTLHPAQGHFRYAVYGDTYAEDLIATSGTFRATVFRGAVSNAPEDKPVVPAMYNEVAGDASMLRLEYQGVENNTDADATEEGMTLDQAGSNADRGMAVGRLRL